MLACPNWYTMCFSYRLQWFLHNEANLIKSFPLVVQKLINNGSLSNYIKIIFIQTTICQKYPFQFQCDIAEAIVRFHLFSPSFTHMYHGNIGSTINYDSTTKLTCKDNSGAVP